MIDREGVISILEDSGLGLPDCINGDQDQVVRFASFKEKLNGWSKENHPEKFAR